jgi:hypothetical protein
MSDTGPTPAEFHNDLEAEKPSEDARPLRDLEEAELRDQPAWLRDEVRPTVRFRWYFIEYGSDGRQIGQIHVRARDEAEAVEAAQSRIRAGHNLSRGARWQGASF